MRETRWGLRQLGTTEVRRSYIASRQPYLRLRADTTAEGHGGCNSFGGKAQLNDAQVSFPKLRNTRMACDDMPTETAFMQALAATHYYRISGNTLFLYADAQSTGTALAQLEAVPAQRDATVK
ncbi:MAG: META domain-containing protein [Janthinobacterium lividum]